MVNKGLHLKSSTLKQKTNKQKVYLEVNDRFDIKRHFWSMLHFSGAQGFANIHCSYF